VVKGSTKGEAERSRKQNRDGVEVLGLCGSGSWAMPSRGCRTRVRQRFGLEQGFGSVKRKQGRSPPA
jgi:hypothetical protein